MPDFHARQGEALWPSYKVDELCYVHMNGRMVLEFDGAEPVTLNAAEAVQVLWLPSAGNAVTSNRTPPARVYCETDWVAGLLVLLRKAGVHWDLQNYMVTPNGTDDRRWQPIHADKYWRSVADCFPGLFKEPHPFVSKLPLVDASIEEEFRNLRMPINMDRDYHQTARAAGQVDYAEVRGWQTGLGTNTRRRPILDFRLLLFPGTASTVEKDEVRLAKHQNGHEILVPLVGEFRCVGGEVEPEEFVTHHGHDEVNAFVPRDEGIALDQLTESYVQATKVRQRCLPDYVSVWSDAVFHGFTAMHGRDAYALHIRGSRSIATSAKERDEERDTVSEHDLTGSDK